SHLRLRRSRSGEGPRTCASRPWRIRRRLPPQRRRSASVSWTISLVDGARDALDREARAGVRLAHELLRESLDDAEDGLVRRNDRRADEVDRLPGVLQAVLVLLDEIGLARVCHAEDAREATAA